VQVPTDAETTQPVPIVPPAPSHQPEHLTVGLPLLDMLAPQRSGPPTPAQPGDYGPPPGEYGHQPAEYARQPGEYGPPPGDYGPLPAYQPMPPQPPRRGRPGAKLVAGIAAGVLLLTVLGVWALGSSPPPTSQGRPSTPAPTTSAIRVADGYQFIRHAARTDTDCAANAYGKTAEFFKGTPCTGLDRALYTSTADGRPAVVSVAIVQMPNERAATDLKKIVDTSGTGNVSDLLRAGVRVPGGPDSLTDAGYASGRDGSTVVIVEADFADPAVKDDAALERVSTAALQLGK